MLRRHTYLVALLAWAVLAGACSGGVDGDTAIEGSTSEETESPPDQTEGEAAEDDPEFIELTYWEQLLLADSFELGSEACEDVDDETRVCEYEQTFESVATPHFGRLDEFAQVITTNHAVSCPNVDRPGGASTIEGDLTSQYGDLIEFESIASGDCFDEPAFWVVRGGTGRFTDASGTMSFSSSGTPGKNGSSIGQLRVRSELWADLLPPAPAPRSDPEADHLEVPYFETTLSTEVTAEADEQCNRGDPDKVTCLVQTDTVLRGALLGNATASATGERTQLLDEACQSDGSSTGIPVVTELEGTITSELGDSLFFVSRERTDPCVSNSYGARATTTYWRVTGGTGRFADAHGLMTGVQTDDFGFPGISVGTLSVRSDLWSPLADEYAELPSGPDFVQLRHWGVLPLDGPDEVVETTAECAAEAIECVAFDRTEEIAGAQIGKGTAVSSGTISTFDEPCGPGGAKQVIEEGEGQIAAPNGDRVDFGSFDDSCALSYWTIDGGTGRYENAKGVIARLGDASEADLRDIHVGVVVLDRTLWTDIIPSP